MNGHKGPVSAMTLDYDEKGFFSAGWDGEAIVSYFSTKNFAINQSLQQWDLNTGHKVRSFTAHNAQLTSIAIRPLSPAYARTHPVSYGRIKHTDNSGQLKSISNAMNIDNSSKSRETEPNTSNAGQMVDSISMDTDARSDASFDPLFDDVPEEAIKQQADNDSKPVVPNTSQPLRAVPSTKPPPKGAPPLFDPSEYATYSPDLLMTAFIDGQVILWDRRANTPGKGVGRLWMSDKTPPWCLSVCSLFFVWSPSV